MAENMLSVVKYDAGGVEIKLEPETVKNYLVRGNGKVTDQEVLFFIRTCQAQKLNPLVYGEVYLIKFGNEPAQLVIGKETYMKRAFKNPELQWYEIGNRCSAWQRYCSERGNVPLSLGNTFGRMV